MKDKLNKIVSMLLCAVLLLGFAPLMKAKAAETYHVGDMISFGTYPQSRVRDEGLKAELESLTPDDRNDVLYNGHKYRRHGTDYYLYEKVYWRVISVEENAIEVLADKVLDSHAYDDIDWETATREDYKAITWENCSLRQWLNNDFYNTAFTETEKAAVLSTKLDNSRGDGDEYDHDEYTGPDTTDKIYVPSYYDMDAAHGLGALESRQKAASEFASEKGVYKGDGFSRWWLRSRYDYYYADLVYPDGISIHYYNVNSTGVGCAPALRLNLQPDLPNVLGHMEIMKDNNCFIHWYPSFFASYSPATHMACKTEKEKKKYLSQFKYEISDEAFDELLDWYKEFNTNIFGGDTGKFLGCFGKNRLQKERDKAWGGSCFGISASAALVYANKIDLADFTGVDGNYYEVSSKHTPANNPGFRDLINYYQLLQYINYFGVNQRFNNDLTTSEFNNELENIIKNAKTAEWTGMPFLILMRYEHQDQDTTVKGGHAIICVGEDGYDEDGNFQVRIIDPNRTHDYNTMKINKDEASGNYSLSFDNDYDGYIFKFVGRLNISDITMFTPSRTRSSGGSYTPDMTHISFGANDILHITDMDTGKTLSISSGTYSGDIEVANAYYYFNGLNELSDNEIAMDIEHGSRYSVTFETDSDFSISSDTDYYAFDMLGADSLDIDFESGATLKGDDIYYNSYISLSENDNLLSLTGSCNEQISFAKAENGTLSVQGKNNVLEKGKLFIDEKTEEKEINIENNSFVVSIDNDKIEILRHSMSEVSAVAPTCTADGNNKYYQCDICGKFFKDPEGKTATTPMAEKIPALGHTDTDNDGKCDRCGKKLCNHICHSTNPLLKFFWKIINFFNKLFKINQYCKCGAKHW